MAADRDEAIRFIAQARSLRGSNEAVMRGNLLAYLPKIFPGSPWWVSEHIAGAEYAVRYFEPDGMHRGHVDVVVGRTPIEYESDLSVAAKLDEGTRQIRQYLAGMANDGHPVGQLRGIVSDTLTWYAYRPLFKRSAPDLGEADVELELIEPRLELTTPDALHADRLVAFLERHLAREGSRPLSAASLAASFGREAERGVHDRAELLAVVRSALSSRPEYAELIRTLWARFVAYPGAGSFDESVYSDELYLVTVAKLVCANVVAMRPLISSDSELVEVLSGTWFTHRGLDNFVEHDFFGWLAHAPFVGDVLPIARGIQAELRTYDFATPAAQDLFGELFAQMASDAQRILLGQEWTPQWLARRVVAEVVNSIEDAPPRLIDMCCGSGAFVVAAVDHVVRRLTASGRGPDDPQALTEVLTVVTAFDIDPLAVILARVNWVVAARPWLGDLDGTFPLPIPVYQADSLFVVTGLHAGDQAGDHYELHLLDTALHLPKALAAPERRAFFDELIHALHRVALARVNDGSDVQPGDAEAALAQAEGRLAAPLQAAERDVTAAFADALVRALHDAERRGLNGLWSFVLRNNYRPALVRGQFNGIVSNPPWLAMSKLLDNPYKAAIDAKMTAFGVRPSGAAHPHAELATVFLMEAVDRYLCEGGVVGCVLPGTVVNGGQHNNFRRQVSGLDRSPVGLSVARLWQVAKGVFKNRAVVFFGVKA